MALERSVGVEEFSKIENFDQAGRTAAQGQ